MISEAVADNTSAALAPIAAYSNGNALYDSTYGSRPSAAKTGTAQLGDTGENKDAWMVGYTPQLSTAVWVGTNKGTALRNSYGGTIYGSGLPAQIWRAQMNAALEGLPIEEFPEPEAVGGQAGVPYEPPPTTYTPTETSRNRSRPRLPGEGEDGNITVLPGLTIPRGNGGDDGDSGDTGDSGDDGGGVSIGPAEETTGSRSRG